MRIPSAVFVSLLAVMSVAADGLKGRVTRLERMNARNERVHAARAAEIEK